MSSLADRLERKLYAAAIARQRHSAGYLAVLERTAPTCRADPEIAEPLDRTGL